jgi:hypothetical protein
MLVPTFRRNITPPSSDWLVSTYKTIRRHNPEGCHRLTNLIWNVLTDLYPLLREIKLFVWSCNNKCLHTPTLLMFWSSTNLFCYQTMMWAIRRRLLLLIATAGEQARGKVWSWLLKAVWTTSGSQLISGSASEYTKKRIGEGNHEAIWN